MENLENKKQLEDFFNLIFNNDNFESIIEIVDKTFKNSKYFKSNEIYKIYDYIQSIGNEAYFGCASRFKNLLNKRSSIKDIGHVKILWVDIDCHEINITEEERQIKIDNILNSFKNELLKYNIIPTSIVYSGNGYHVYFVLDNQIIINDEILKTFNQNKNIKDLFFKTLKSLSLMANSDLQVCTLDRILRIPTTFNRKNNQEKQSKIIEFNPDNIYNINDFNEIVKKYNFKPEKSCEICPFNKNEELGFIPPCILSGLDINNKVKEGFRNTARTTLAIYCYNEKYTISKTIELLNHIVGDDDKEVKDDVSSIYKSLDSGKKYSIGCGEGSKLNYLINNGVLKCDRDKCDFYSKKIIDEKNYIKNNIIESMNLEYSYIENMCRVIREYYDENEKEIKIKFLTIDEFENIFLSDILTIRDINGKIKKINKGKYWLSHKNKNSYRDIVFIPKNNIKNDYNLWKGFKVEPIEGDCSKYLYHLKYILCKGNEIEYKYLINWLAHIIQKPYEKTDVAVVIRGEKGTGKTIFYDYFSEIFRKNNRIKFDNSDCWISNFNMYSQKILLCSDEAFKSKFDKRIDSTVKNIITSNDIKIKEKYLPEREEKNYINTIFISNENDVVKASLQERRYFCVNISNDKFCDRKYFDNLIDEMNNGGVESLLFYLMNYKLDINLRDVPETNELINQKKNSLESFEKFLYEFIYEKIEDGFDEINISKDDFYREYLNFCKSDKFIEQLSKLQLIKKLKKYIIGCNTNKKIKNEFTGNWENSYNFDVKTIVKNFEKELKITFDELSY